MIFFKGPLGQRPSDDPLARAEGQWKNVKKAYELILLINDWSEYQMVSLPPLLVFVVFDRSLIETFSYNLVCGKRRGFVVN